MTTAAFVDYIIEEYSAWKDDCIPGSCDESRGSASQDDTSVFFRHMMADNSDAMLEGQVTKKKAALILYAFITDVLKLKDTDWGEAGKFRDIYDCRICANAIAQVYGRGIMDARSPEVFGIGDSISDDELKMSVFRLLNHINII